MRQLVDKLHSGDQHYIVMVDPAVGYQDFPETLQRCIDIRHYAALSSKHHWCQDIGTLNLPSFYDTIVKILSEDSAFAHDVIATWNE